ncbi:MAG: large-conductance mechanosensitive channel protein MscL [Patescibacteria group bacterium]|nr:large-conductance mechanosensitive channel protein MscL [Patescibacteria group bacterium]
MKQVLAEFKTFALRGNVMDLAVAFIMGAAFGNIVSSLVNNLMLPAIGVLLGNIDLSGLHLKIGASVIQYGLFLQNVVDFLIVASAVFLIVKAINSLKRKQQEEPAMTPEPSEDILLLREIRDLLTRKNS